MSIDSINVNRFIKDTGKNWTSSSNNKMKSDETSEVRSGEISAARNDKLELSSASKSPIQSKLMSGFYSKPEVIRQVALRMNKDI